MDRNGQPSGVTPSLVSESVDNMLPTLHLIEYADDPCSRNKSSLCAIRLCKEMTRHIMMVALGDVLKTMLMSN